MKKRQVLFNLCSASLLILAAFICFEGSAQTRNAGKRKLHHKHQPAKLSNQVIGIVLTDEARADMPALKAFLQQQKLTIPDSTDLENTQVLKVTAPGTPDPDFNNAPLAALRKSRLVRWAGTLQQQVMIETGQITVETQSPEKASALKTQLPPSIAKAEQDGPYLILTVQPHIGSGIHEIARTLEKNPSVRYVNVNVYPGEFLKD
ncbi:MAG: hypothetical protein WCF67_05555 [Chitinophagaceae bacterium]